MKEAMKRGDLFPLFVVSSEKTYGISALLTEIVQLMPSAYEMEEIHAFKGAEGDKTVEIHAEDNGRSRPTCSRRRPSRTSARSRTSASFSGTVSNGQEVYNATRDGVEKMGHLSVAQGKDRIEVPILHPGDIGCVAKLRNTHTNDTLSTREHPVRLPQIHFPEPIVTFAVQRDGAARRGEAAAGHSPAARRGPDVRDSLCAGDARDGHQRHGRASPRSRDVEAQAERRACRRSWRVRALPIARRSRRRPKGRAATRNSRAAADSSATAGFACGPTPRGKGYEFIDEIVGGSIPSKFIPAVDKGIQEASARGVLAGYPMVDFAVELFDGSYHSVDSNEMSFKMAGIQGFKTVAPKCRPVLLEPLDEIEISTPDQYLGDVMGDISSRRGSILGTDSLGDARGTRVRAVVPQAELHLYATDLHSMTHGRGTFARRFHGYEQMPGDAAQKVIEESAKVKEGELAEV